jgi:hypothetical protein
MVPSAAKIVARSQFFIEHAHPCCMGDFVFGGAERSNDCLRLISSRFTRHVSSGFVVAIV